MHLQLDLRVVSSSCTRVLSSLSEGKEPCLCPLLLGKLTSLVVVFPDVLQELSTYSDKLTILFLLSKLLLHGSINEGLRLPWTLGPIYSPEEGPGREVVRMVVGEVVLEERVLLQHPPIYVLHQQGLMVGDGHRIGIAILDILE